MLPQKVINHWNKLLRTTVDFFHWESLTILKRYVLAQLQVRGFNVETQDEIQHPL